MHGKQEEGERLLGAINVVLQALLLQEPSEGGRPLRYNPLDYAVLRRLEENDGISGSELARQLKIARTTLQSALERLQRAGLLRKHVRPGQKVRTLHLTARGKNIRRKIHRHDLVNMTRLLSPLSAKQRSQTIENLERIAASFDDQTSAETL
ncbi:MAG: hypothetical protein Cons2KO_18630 [Congregibacter sp.]